MWKSNNQGLKEATFIQKGRRVRIVEQRCRGCSEVWRSSGSGRQTVHVWWIKIRKDTLEPAIPAIGQIA